MIPTKEQIKTANWLIRESDGRPEDYIRKRVCNLLDSMDFENEIGYPPPLASGSCDIYLPRRRTIFETKTTGLVDEPEKPQSRKNPESPKQQLERYLRAEIEYELDSLGLEGKSNRPWTGILTDGRLWHIWRYSNEPQSVGIPVRTYFEPTNGEVLVSNLHNVLQGELVGKPWIPSDPQRVFEPRLRSLEQIYENLPKSAKPFTNTKYLLWLSMLRTASMEPENELAALRLFIAHSFLVVLARAVIQVLANPHETPGVEAVCGYGFVAWVNDTVQGRQWASALLSDVHGFEWRRRPGDVLRPLYEQFVGTRDRKVFGEFYTPDWLAELIVSEICDDVWCREAIELALSARRGHAELRGVGVLDPTCGSGTFLYHAAKRLLMSSAAQDLSKTDRATIICDLVHGIDVHPVAAEISRATLLRALPTEPTHGEAALQIHEGDALLILGEGEEHLFRPTNNEIRIETPGGSAVSLPRGLVDQVNFEDDLRRLVISAVRKNGVPSDIIDGKTDEERKAIQLCHEQLIDIIKSEGNSVWTWYIRNITGPYRLSEKKVNRIVANPPWVKMASIQAETRKRTLESFAAKKEIDLWSGGKQAPHFDIAQLFIKRSRQLYLKNPVANRAAWLVKNSCLKAGHWEKFRKWHSSVLKQSLDLERVKPFGGGDARRCCVLFECESTGLGHPTKKHLEMVITEGKPPTTHENLKDVQARTEILVKPDLIPEGESDYLDDRKQPVFRMGANFVPRVLVVAESVENSNDSSKKKVSTLKSMHTPWRQVQPQQGVVPKRWLVDIILSNDVLPFGLSPFRRHYAIVPRNEKGFLSREHALSIGFWQKLEEIYSEHKGSGRNTPQDLIAQIDFGSKLSSQLNNIKADCEKRVVVYPSSGDIMRACRLNSGESVIDYTLFRYSVHDVDEAAYLVALLNAPSLQDAYTQSRRSGRHFQLHPWRTIPIKRFDRKNKKHLELVNLTEEAERRVVDWLNDSLAALTLGQVGLSKRLRSMLKIQGIYDELDRISRNLLPDQIR